MTHRDSGEQFDAEDVMREAMVNRTVEDVRLEEGFLVVMFSDQSTVRLPFDDDARFHVEISPKN